MHFETKAIHAGQEPDSATGAVIVPIYQTSTYAQESPGRHKGYEYTRSQNPTRKALEACAASLENGKYGLAFASGMAAINNVMNLLSAGDHVVSTDDVYGGTYRIFERVFRQYGISYTFVDSTKTENIRNAITAKTKVIWIETPTNPLLKLVDIREAARLAKKAGALCVVDNTFATPFFQKPLDLGADVVVHSTTKYLGGHSDVVGGLAALNDEAVYQKLKFYQNAVGGTPGPFDCFLVMRGLKTLGVRMERHFKNALKVAGFLEGHPAVEKVVFPWLESHPQHELAKSQMSGMSGMISFEIKGGIEAARRFLEKVRIFTLAESLGGVESLIEHPAIMTHASLPKEVREKNGITDGLIRLSVGLEHPVDLIEDLEQAFASAAGN